MPPSNAIADVSSGTNFVMCLYLHPYFVHASSEGSGESAHICTCSPESSLPDNGSHELAQIYHIDVDFRDRGVGVRVSPASRRCVLVQDTLILD